MEDKFQNRNTGFTGPATHGRHLTPNDGANLVDVPRWITADTAGTIRVDMLDNVAADNPVDIPIEQGAMLFIRPIRIYDAGTTAANLKGFW